MICGSFEPYLTSLSSDVKSRLLVLEAGGAERSYWADRRHYRELFAVLAWRDVAVRYKQTIIGIAWAIVRPLLTMVVFSVVFGKLAKLPSEGRIEQPLPIGRPAAVEGMLAMLARESLPRRR